MSVSVLEATPAGFVAVGVLILAVVGLGWVARRRSCEGRWLEGGVEFVGEYGERGPGLERRRAEPGSP